MSYIALKATEEIGLLTLASLCFIVFVDFLMRKKEFAMTISVETLLYTSSVDGVGPMKMEVALLPGKKRLPVVAVMTGYHGTRAEVRQTVERLAAKGLCAVGIDMRGRDGAPGHKDSGAVEIYDIVDALNTVCKKYSEAVDRDTWHIVGYSGGGGNVFSAVTKFPGRFVVACEFFGISDYEVWYQTTSRKDCVQSMNNWIGGSPGEFPGRYQARSSLLAAGNAQWTDVHLFWDEEETQCPEPMHSRFKEEAQKQSDGKARVTPHCSRKTDENRWYHGYPDGVPSLIAAEDIFVPLMLSQKGPLKLPSQGQLAVPGFVVTPKFEYWVGDGKTAAGRIEYSTDSYGKVTIKNISF